MIPLGTFRTRVLDDNEVLIGTDLMHDGDECYQINSGYIGYRVRDYFDYEGWDHGTWAIVRFEPVADCGSKYQDLLLAIRGALTGAPHTAAPTPPPPTPTEWACGCPRGPADVECRAHRALPDDITQRYVVGEHVVIRSSGVRGVVTDVGSWSDRSHVVPQPRIRVRVSSSYERNFFPTELYRVEGLRQAGWRWLEPGEQIVEGDHFQSDDDGPPRPTIDRHITRQVLGTGVPFTGPFGRRHRTGYCRRIPA